MAKTAPLEEQVPSMFRKGPKGATIVRMLGRKAGATIADRLQKQAFGGLSSRARAALDSGQGSGRVRRQKIGNRNSTGSNHVKQSPQSIHKELATEKTLANGDPNAPSDANGEAIAVGNHANRLKYRGFSLTVGIAANPPKPAGWGGRIRTCEWRHQKPLPYHLATPHYPIPICQPTPGGQTNIKELKITP